MLNNPHILLFIMISFAIFIILQIIFNERIMLLAFSLNEKIFRNFIEKGKNISDNAFVSKVAEEFDVPFIDRKISLERMDRSINNQQRKLLKKLWNKRALATRKGVSAVRRDFTKYPECDAEFFLNDFETFVENSLSSPDFHENVNLWCEITECLTSPEEVLYLMYIVDLKRKNKSLSSKLLDMTVSGQMILYAYTQIQEKG